MLTWRSCTLSPTSGSRMSVMLFGGGGLEVCEPRTKKQRTLGSLRHHAGRENLQLALRAPIPAQEHRFLTMPGINSSASPDLIVPLLRTQDFVPRVTQLEKQIVLDISADGKGKDMVFDTPLTPRGLTCSRQARHGFSVTTSTPPCTRSSCGCFGV